jgi:hypothetical protein
MAQTPLANGFNGLKVVSCAVAQRNARGGKAVSDGARHWRRRAHRREHGNLQPLARAPRHQFVSDGYDTGTPEQLASEMCDLRAASGME